MSKETVVNEADYSMRLNFDPGSHLTVRFKGMNDRVEGTLIGQDPLHYLIIRVAPTPGLDEVVKEGDLINVGYFCLGNEYGFEAEVLGTINKPFRLVLISYPDKVKSIDARRAKRYSCHIPATMRIRENQVSGFVSGISENGCRFIVKVPGTLHTRQVNLVSDLELSFPFTGRHEQIHFNGSVTNTAVDRDRICMGVEFKDQYCGDSGSRQEFIRMIAEIAEVGLTDFPNLESRGRTGRGGDQ